MMRVKFGILTKNGFKQTNDGSVWPYRLSNDQAQVAKRYLEKKKIDGAATVQLDYYAVKIDGASNYNGHVAYVQLWDRDECRTWDCDNFALPVAAWD